MWERTWTTGPASYAKFKQANKLEALIVSKFEVLLSLLSAKMLANIPCDLYTDNSW